MMMVVNLPWLSQMIDNLQLHGRMAAEIHMSEETSRHFVGALVATREPCGDAKDFLKHTSRKVTRPTKTSVSFRNVPLVINPKIPDGGLVIRPLHMMKDRNWLEKALDEQRDSMAKARNLQAAAGQSGDSRPRVPTPEPQPPSGPESSGDFFRHGNEGTVTDILVNAATGCDNVRKVIVIRVDDKSEIDLRSNCSRFEIFGLLQAVMSRVAMGDGGYEG